MIPDAEQAMVQSHLEPIVLPASRYRADSLIRRTRIRDRFVSEDARIGTQCGDDRVAGASSPHTGFHDMCGASCIGQSISSGSGIPLRRPTAAGSDYGVSAHVIMLPSGEWLNNPRAVVR
jgi:hypothetical protein